jgi:hypothetical protein
MKKLTAVFAALLVVALAAPTYAGIDEGDWELQVAVDWFIGDLQNSFGGEIALGYFVTPEIEIGGWLGYNYRDVDGTVEFKGSNEGDIEWTESFFEIAFFGAYYFETDGEWMPYVGGFLGYEDGEIEIDSEEIVRDGFMMGAILGIKYFVSEKTTIFIEYRLVWRFEDEWELDDDSDYTIDDDEIAHLILVGISVLF